MKKEMIFEDRSGDKDSVFLYVSRYYSNKSFYVGLSSIIDGGPDYGDLTICLPQYKLGRTTAAINGDSTEEILRFIFFKAEDPTRLTSDGVVQRKV